MRAAKGLNTIHFLLLAFGALLTLCAWQAGGPSEILGTLPAILLAVALAFNRYPGEELIAKLAVRRGRPPRRPASSPRRRLPGPADLRPRGTDLLAFSLAKRPPPLRPLSQIY